MRRAQSSIEVVIATTLLAVLLTAAGAGAFAAWRHAELAVAGVAAQRAAQRGGDPLQAAVDVLPLALRHEAPRAVRGGR
jgi:hypothetical protein